MLQKIPRVLTTALRRLALQPSEVNPRLCHLEYSVLGSIMAQAERAKADLDNGVSKPFSKLIMCNAGDCQAAGQKPITFFRQVAALCMYPDLLNDNHFPSDAKERAERILNSCSGGSIGAYGHHIGIKSIREDVAAFIERRDGFPANMDNIAMTTGATGGMDCLLNALSTGQDGKHRAGLLIPKPGYSLYGAHNTKYHNLTVAYYLDEEKNWGISASELERALEAAKEHCKVRGLVIINPGNPTGQVITTEDLQDALKVAHKHNLTVIADEVYQENVYGHIPFVSARKVLFEMGPPYSEEVELVSFMSISKGYYSECGLRSGYFELVNTHPGVKELLFKDLSLLSSTPTIGQAVMAAVVNPPRPSEPSFEEFDAQRAAILGDLSIKAEFLTEALNSVPGISCNEISAAMYAFPRLDLPPGAIRAAKDLGLEPDAFYAEELLKEVGVCCVPGSGFGQVDGTSHIRLTLVPSLEELKELVARLKIFQNSFLRRYDEDCATN